MFSFEQVDLSTKASARFFSSSVGRFFPIFYFNLLLLNVSDVISLVSIASGIFFFSPWMLSFAFFCWFFIMLIIGIYGSA